MLRCVGVLAALGLSTPLLAGDLALVPKLSSWIDRNPRHVLRQLNQSGLYASMGSVADGAGSGPGLAYFEPHFGRTPVDLYIGRALSFSGDSVFNVRVGRIPHVSGHIPTRRRSLEALTPSLVDGSAARPFFIYGELRLQELGNGQIHGLGGRVVPFFYEDRSAELVAGRRLGSGLVASLRAGWLQTSGGLGPRVANDPRIGSFGASGGERSFLATTATVAYDRRDRPRDPRRGGFVEAALARFESVGRAASFDRFSLDARRYVPLGSERHVVALRGLVDVASGGGDALPFFLQPTLGGSRTLRSFAWSRFRGPRLAALSAEYRWSVAKPVELAAFSDLGRVWGGSAETGTRGLATSYGLGVRLKSKSNVLVRLDAARGSEGARLNLSFGGSF